MTKQDAQAANSLANAKPLILELADLTAEKRDLEKDIKDLREKVLPLIEGRGKLQVENYIVETKTMPGRKTIDKDALAEFLKQHGKTVADFEKVGAPFSQFNLSEAAEKI